MEITEEMQEQAEAAPKVAANVVEAEFERWALAWDLDIEIDEMDDDDRKGFLEMKRRITRKMREGKIEIDDAASIVYTLEESIGSTDAITFKLPTGNAILQWDKYKDKQQVHKLNAFMGASAGIPSAIFAKMDGRDLKVCQAVALLFLGS